MLHYKQCCDEHWGACVSFNSGFLGVYAQNQPILKEINPECLLEGLMLKLKFHYFGPLMQRASALEKTLMLGKIEDRRKRGDRG